MANGRVATGFSMPRVAKYEATGTTVTYTGVMALARGVEVTLSPESSDENIFYADNVSAESATGEFTGGTVSLTVDGLLDAAARFIFGLPEADTAGWIAYDDTMNIPYVGIGYITRYMSDGVTTYVPTVIAKARFSLPEKEAATQEDEIDWQTQELEATLFRADDANHTWLYEGAPCQTETAALAALDTKLGGTSGATT